MDRKKRDRLELYRTIALLSDFLDKSTRVMILGIIGSILIAVPASVYLLVFLETPSLYTTFVVLVSITYIGSALLLLANRYRRRSKKAFENYMDMIMRDSLVSDSDYAKLVSTLRNEIAHSLEKAAQEPRVYPSKDEIESRKKELALTLRNTKQAQARRERLSDQILLLEKTTAMLERRIYDLTKTERGHKASREETATGE